MGDVTCSRRSILTSTHGTTPLGLILLQRSSYIDIGRIDLFSSSTHNSVFSPRPAAIPISHLTTRARGDIDVIQSHLQSPVHSCESIRYVRDVAEQGWK